MGVITENLPLGASPATGSDKAAVRQRASSTDEAEAGSASPHGRRALLFSGLAYLGLSVFIWSNVWTSHPTSVTTCGCGDPSQFIWFIEWPAYAISHGLDPTFSTALHYPVGVNMLAFVSVFAIGVPLAPITWVFGPVASLNVAVTLAPVLSALAMYVLLRRWVTWMPAAFIGGLFYGFSPFIVVSLTNSDLNLGMLVVPPLFLACLDELLVRQRRRPVVIGVALGLLVTLQFFIATEILAITVIMGAVGVAILVGYAAWRHRDAVRSRARHAIVGLAAGVVTAVVLLAVPTWVALAGPAHFSGPIWPYGKYDDLRNKPTYLGYYVHGWPASFTHLLTTLAHTSVGGNQGPVLSFQYFGYGVIIVLIGGLIAWRRDRRLWLFGAIVVASVIVSLGVGRSLADKLPQVENLVPYRFVLVTYLAAAVMLGLILEHVYVAVNQFAEHAHKRSQGRPANDARPWWQRRAGAAVALVVAAIAIVPPAVYLAPSIPITTQPVDVPTWFRTVAPHLQGHQILLVLPAPFLAPDNAMTWQAMSGMHFSMVGSSGPAGILQRVVKEQAGAAILSDVSEPVGAPEANSAIETIQVHHTIKPDYIPELRQALDEWGVTMVVIPDQRDLPLYDQMPSVTFAAALVSASTGQRPLHQANAWVWTGVEHAPPPVISSSAHFSACIKGLPPHGEAAVVKATGCVLDATPSP
ncbi:MAG: DUF2079 domain-containing protein [Acidimicrobiales bacterium]